MVDKVLLSLTEEHLETGLRGVPVGYCTTSFVDPMQGLFYVGKPVATLSALPPIAVIYLLYHGKEGSEKEVALFEKELQKRRVCHPKAIQAIEALPRDGHPMQLLIAALMILSMFEVKGDYREDCLNLIAKIPHLTAIVINHHAGWGKTKVPQESAGYMESFCEMLQAPHLDRKALIPVMNLFSILHFDHGGGNLSTFVGKAVASSLEDLYGSIAASFAALAGPRHGRANQDCLEFVQGVLKEVGENATQGDVEKLIAGRLAAGKLVYGFGHAVLRVEDPRATVFYDFAKQRYPQNPPREDRFASAPCRA